MNTETTIDEILDLIWEEFAPTEETTLTQSLILCYNRCKELECLEQANDAFFAQQDVLEDIDANEEEDSELGEDCGNPGCPICSCYRDSDGPKEAA